ncbi:MAG: nitroreductase [Pseudomonadota bacterium]
MTPAPDVLAFLLNRRSSRPKMLAAPGPSADELRTILTAAARVPDHKKIVPWRFLKITGDARSALGEALAEIVRAEAPPDDPPGAVRLQTERERFGFAPLVVAVVSSPRLTDRVPAHEQVLSAGAAAFNLCLAANALGYHTAWVTDWPSTHDGAKALLGLEAHEAIAGFVHVGTAAEDQPDRDRPDLSDIVTAWSPPGAQQDN